MARPRKADKAKGNDAAAAQNLAADALICFPADIEKLKEEFIEVRRQLAEMKAEAAGDLSSHEKRLDKLYGSNPWVRSRLNELLAMKEGHRQRSIRQIMWFIRVLGLDAQLDLFNETAAPGGVEPESGSVFDKTASGDKMAAERLDDPGRASKRRGPPPAPVVTTPNVGVEGLAAGIKPLESPEEKRARIDAQKAADAAAFEKPGKASPADKAETIEADTKHMTPAQKRAHAKKIADEVFAKQGNAGLGSDGIH